MEEITCCFTGHRSLPLSCAKEISERLESQLINIIEQHDSVTFRAGGAVGFDTLAALKVLELKKRFRDKRIRLELFLPCKNQTSAWDAYSKKVYEYILKKCDSYCYINEKYTPYCMFERNRALVNGSDVCVAYFNGEPHGGTYYTVTYAHRHRVRLINIAELI